MHELGLARNIVAIVGEHAAGRPVRRVRLTIGPRACVERAALDFCWDLVTEGTALAGARLGFVDGAGDAFLIKDYELREGDRCAEPADAPTRATGSP